MKGDFTRMTFDPKKHYRGVLLQQGRVQLDADWNEQIDIQAYRVETETRDVIGACGTPIDQPGFTLIVDARTLPANKQTDLTKLGLLPLKPGDFLIGPGRYYVDGILCENEDYVLSTQQPDRPGDDPKKPPSQPELEIKPIAEAGLHLAYLDVWTRHITALDDESIREKALGGPDTATRDKTIWQVKTKKLDSDKLNCTTVVVPGDESTGQLSARSKPLHDQKEPCEVPLGGGYRRLENQLYRVEIHTGGKETAATFKWSRDNASMVTTWKSKNGNDLTVGNGGPDEVLGFAANQWIELSDDTRELQGQPGTLVKLVKPIGQTLTIDQTTATGPVELSFFPHNPKVRRWDTIATTGGVRNVNDQDTPDGFIRLEDGVEIKFEKGEYRTGDYWLIPARTAADVEWPKEQNGDPIPQPKHGIYHHTCSLGLLKFDTTKTLAVQEDCRRFFSRLTDLTCLYYVGGDGQEGVLGTALPKPLQVGVANGNHPVKDANVIFTILDDNNNEVKTTPVKSDARGVAQFTWTLGTKEQLRVRAQLINGASQIEHLPIIFSAQYSQGDAVDPGIHVKDIAFLDGTRFHNDTEFAVDLLARGLKIACDENVHALSVRSQPTSNGSAEVSPTVFVTLDLPYPFNSADRELWGEAVVAYQPVILSGSVYAKKNFVIWEPTPNTNKWLTGQLFQKMQKRGKRILAHLTMKGNFIWSEKTRDLYLDGEVFGMDPTTGAAFIEGELPSGNKRRGGDLEMWFWLAAQDLKRVVLLGNPAMAAFKLPETRKSGLADAFNLAIDRGVLRGEVPPQFTMNLEQVQDIDAAKKLIYEKKLQGTNFTAWSEKLLFEANQTLAGMLSPLDITIKPAQVDGLLKELPKATEAGKAPEAVLVDAASADQLGPLGYTYEIVKL